MQHPTEHILVKAPVDVLIIPLVQALQAFPEVATIHSCQGDPISKEWSWNNNAAYVIFRAGASITECAVFLDFLAEHLAKLEPYIRLQLSVVKGVPQVEIRLQQCCITDVVTWLSAIIKRWQGMHTEMVVRNTKFQ